MAASPLERERTRHHQEAQGVLGKFRTEAFLAVGILADLGDRHGKRTTPRICDLDGIRIDHLIVYLDDLPLFPGRETYLLVDEIMLHDRGGIRRQRYGALEFLGLRTLLSLLLVVF